MVMGEPVKGKLRLTIDNVRILPYRGTSTRTCVLEVGSKGVAGK